MKKAFSILLVLSLLLSLSSVCLAAEPPELTATAEAENIAKYGNLVLSLTCEELREAGYEYGDILTVRFLDTVLELPLCSNYTDVDSGEPGIFARAGDINVILAVCMGDFAAAYGLAVKTVFEDRSFVWNWAEGITGPVTFTFSLKEAGGYREEYLLHQLVYTDDRADYPELSDAEFANFRVVETTGMGKGVLYRTASPVNPLHNRNRCADKALRRAGVTVVMNLADDEETARSYAGFGRSYYSTTAFIALNMGVDFQAPEFREKLADGLRFFAEHPGIYAVHCTEGKDRAGFVIAVLECLMGAGFDEVAADYMRTFYNYYGVLPGEERYDAVLSSNLVKSLSRAFGVEDLRAADLAECAADYLRNCGLSGQELAALRRNLAASPERGERVYTVVPGDCLWALARRFYGNPLKWERIAQANALSDPDLIFAGQRLRIPA